MTDNPTAMLFRARRRPVHRHRTPIERVCGVPDCGRPFRARGLCSGHLYRLVKHGDVQADKPITTYYKLKPEQRLLGRVRVDGDCWTWTGNLTDGYGKIMVNGKRNVAVHRLAYELLVGPIPEDLTLDHLCRNRACVNPAHLEPVPIGVNVLRGENPPARNARKTHCFRGHPFTEENTYRDRGRRRCRECLREAARRRWARR